MANNNDRSPEEQVKLDESLDLLDEFKTIPAYKALESMEKTERGIKKAVVEKYKDFASWEGKVLNQLLFDIGALTYNAAAVPMNVVSGFFGYNPGFSGERFMENQPWETGISSLAERPESRFDPDYPWGVFAPEGGERQYTYLPKEQTAEVEPSLAVTPKKEVVTEEITATSFRSDDIDPGMKKGFDNILELDPAEQEKYFTDMPSYLKDAFTEYSTSLRESQLAEENKRKEDLIYDKTTDTMIRNNAPNL